MDGFEGNLIPSSSMVDNGTLVEFGSHSRYEKHDAPLPTETGNFKVIAREWQESFIPDSNSIFRKA